MLRMELDDLNIVEYSDLRKMHDEVVEGMHNLEAWLKDETNKIDHEITQRSNQAVKEIAADVKCADKMSAVQQSSMLLEMHAALRKVKLSMEALDVYQALDDAHDEIAFMMALYKDSYLQQKQALDSMLTCKQNAMEYAAASGSGLSEGREDRAVKLGAVVKPEGYKSREAWEAQRQQELDARQPEVNAMRALLDTHLTFKLDQGPSYLQRHGMFAARPEVRSVNNDNNLSDKEELRSSFSNSM